MVSDMQRTLPELPPFNWQLEYAPHWEGRNDGCLNDILFRPGPDDVLVIDGVCAPFKDHLARHQYKRAYANNALMQHLDRRNDARGCTCNNSVFDYMCEVHTARKGTMQ